MNRFSANRGPVVLARAAVPGPSENATAAYERGDYAAAATLSMPLGAAGNAQYPTLDLGQDAFRRRQVRFQERSNGAVPVGVR
jgi:hypothetical protein